MNILFAAATAAAVAYAPTGGKLVCEPIVAPGGLVAAMVVEDQVEIQGADHVELWLCSRTLCAPALRISDRGGLLFQWTAEGALQASTSSRSAVHLPLSDALQAVPLDLHVIDGRHRDRRPDLEKSLTGVGPVGGLTRTSCVTRSTVSWEGS